MGTNTNTVQQCRERFRQKQLNLDELTQPGWEDAGNYFDERHMKYGTSELKVRAVLQPQTDDDAVAPALRKCGDLLACLDIVARIAQMTQGTSRPGRSHMSRGFGNPQSNTSIPSFAPAVETDSSIIQNVKPVELVSFFPCI